jgi:hypothetical protein
MYVIKLFIAAILYTALVFGLPIAAVVGTALNK